MTIISIFEIGFSIIIAITLFFTYMLFIKHINKTWITVSLSAAVLGSLSLAQFNHYLFYQFGADPLSSIGYRFLILLIPSLFYFFSRAILFQDRKFQLLQLLHFLPLPLAFIVPREIAVPLAFLIGMSYCLWLTKIVFKLKAVRKGFKLVFYFFAFFSLISIMVFIISITTTNIEPAYFYHLYTSTISISFILVIATLIAIPDVLNDIDEIVRLGYSNSTLSSLNIHNCLEKLNQLMCSSKMYQNENLSLSILSTEMQISNHQLSELINSHFDVGFSQYIRNQRIDAAKHLLITEVNASILSISMEVGFKSQSNFYAAFKEITGMSPGNFRTVHSQ